jgi:hypothetical protein
MSSRQQLSQPWEGLYKDVLFEAESEQMPRRIELAKHAILDRLEDVTCARTNQKFEDGELEALRRAHRALRVLEELYLTEDRGKSAANG